MPGFLLDTNVLSEVIRKRPSPKVISRLRDLPSANLYTSAISIMELRFGAVRAGGDALWERIAREVLPLVKVLPLGERESIRAGEILADLETRGAPIGLEDVLIGATALASDLAVATRNVRHLGRISGLRIENWWE